MSAPAAAANGHAPPRPDLEELPEGAVATSDLDALPAGPGAGDETERETAAGTDPDGQRVGVHRGGDADPPPRPRAYARARGLLTAAVKIGRLFAAGMRHDKHHGAPWEEAPQSLKQLRLAIHAKAKVHSVIPGAKELYLTYGYCVSLPYTAWGYTKLWIAQSPVRSFIAFAVTVILHRCHYLPGLPAALVHIPVIGLIAGWLF